MSSASEAIKDVLHLHSFDKDPRFVVESLIRQYRGTPVARRENFVAVYRSWLFAEDVARAGLAITLFQQLDLVEELPLLTKLLEDVRTGKTALPRHFAEFIAPAIEDLGNERLP
jgi:hypothetical protein